MMQKNLSRQTVLYKGNEIISYPSDLMTEFLQLSTPLSEKENCFEQFCGKNGGLNKSFNGNSRPVNTTTESVLKLLTERKRSLLSMQEHLTKCRSNMLSCIVRAKDLVDGYFAYLKTILNARKQSVYTKLAKLESACDIEDSLCEIAALLKSVENLETQGKCILGKEKQSDKRKLIIKYQTIAGRMKLVSEKKHCSELLAAFDIDISVPLELEHCLLNCGKMLVNPHGSEVANKVRISYEEKSPLSNPQQKITENGNDNIETDHPSERSPLFPKEALPKLQRLEITEKDLLPGHRLSAVKSYITDTDEALASCGYPFKLTSSSRKSEETSSVNSYENPNGLMKSLNPNCVNRSESPNSDIKSENPNCVNRSESPNSDIKSEEPNCVNRCENPKCVNKSQYLITVKRSKDTNSVNSSEILNVLNKSENLNCVNKSHNLFRVKRSKDSDGGNKFEILDRLDKSEEPNDLDSANDPQDVNSCQDSHLLVSQKILDLERNGRDLFSPIAGHSSATEGDSVPPSRSECAKSSVQTDKLILREQPVAFCGASVLSSSNLDKMSSEITRATHAASNERFAARKSDQRKRPSSSGCNEETDIKKICERSSPDLRTSACNSDESDEVDSVRQLPEDVVEMYQESERKEGGKLAENENETEEDFSSIEKLKEASEIKMVSSVVSARRIPKRPRLRRCNTLSTVMKQLDELLGELWAMDDSWPFVRAVDKKLVPDYYDIIKTPITLKEIATNVRTLAYSSLDEFVSDIELMYRNCRDYNKPTSVTYNSGRKLELRTMRLLKKGFPGCHFKRHLL